MTPRIINPGSRPVRLDPFQNIVNFSGAPPEWLLIGYLAQWGFDPNGSIIAYSFNTSKLPTSIDLLSVGDTGGWSSYPAQSNPVIYSDTPTPSMAPLAMYHAPDFTAEKIFNPIIPSLFTTDAQIGYAVIKLGQIADPGQTTLDFLINITTSGGGPPAHLADYSGYSGLDAYGFISDSDFLSTWPLYTDNNSNPYQIRAFSQSNTYNIPGDPSSAPDPLFPDGALIWAVEIPIDHGSDAATYNTGGGHYQFDVELATIAKVDHAFRPVSDNSFGTGVYTSRNPTNGQNFTVLGEQFPEGGGDVFYTYWVPSGPGLGDLNTGPVADDVMQGVGYISEGSNAPPPFPSLDGSTGPSGALPFTAIYSVSVDLTTFQVTIARISRT